MNTVAAVRKLNNANLKVQQFEIVHFKDVSTINGDTKERIVLILYALADDGVIYEYTGGKWLGLPINKSTMKETPV